MTEAATPSATVLPFPQKPEDRLRAALRCLDAALAEQRLAVTEFRANLGALGGAVAGLGASVEGYRASLATTASEVEAAHHAARRLEASADVWCKSAR